MINDILKGLAAHTWLLQQSKMGFTAKTWVAAGVRMDEIQRTYL